MYAIRSYYVYHKDAPVGTAVAAWEWGAYLGEASSHPEFYSPENKDGVRARENLALMNIERAKAFLAGAVENGKVEVVVVRRQREDEIVNLLLDLHGSRVGPVDLVDQHDRPLAALQGLLEDETRLG